LKTNAAHSQLDVSRETLRPEVFEDRHSFGLSMPLFEISCDFLLLLAGCMVGGALGHLLQLNRSFAVSFRQLFLGSLIYSGLFICLLQGQRAYPRVCSLLHVKETEIVLRISIKTILVCLVVFALARFPVPRMTALTAWLVGTLALTGGRLWVYDMVRKHFVAASPKRRTLIYGTKRTARRFLTAALHSPKLGIDPVGFVAREGETSDVIYSNDYFHRDSRPVFREQLSVELLEELAVKEVVVCDPAISDRELAWVKEVAQEADCSLSVVDNQEIMTSKTPMRVWEMDGLLVATTIQDEPGRRYDMLKRGMDIFCSSILIFLSAPVWAVLALCIKLESKGPIFFRQTRVGKDGKFFEILKFRSMKVDAPKYAFSPAHHEDPRITRVGRFLRQSSLDEVPQLINVLKGDMSLVGPRPEMPFITEGYGPLESTRLTVPQGITGFWQLSADRRYAIHESIEYDLYYIQNRTLLMDVAILLHTLVYAAKGI
jgi:exopolysaccharide biosynthesis polyprenyl glycosylphosphotransferase